ncbi:MULTISPECIES: helix-turn-helix domain-containing protein [unclassified Methylobacterium]|uniref:MerR family transcriptional regulator n=1 Tax=unclassified Methylobacterium TaxID=2615210 RepID=UPI0011C1DCF6|nr:MULTISPECIES: helix-turn-helix domain-containing protein [unclassified Methylobacterium]QEE41003.1 helix-turn-helix domain-containing protein [Methylobacterium sp. WL1]TXN52795.1 helix-turn-helix domain-containing protein [Methylobacterium sp. WL2]
MSDISIGELARRTSVKVATIRYYEQVGLLTVPTRTEGQQRRYDEAAVVRLNFVRHARELGFDVPAVRELLALSDQPDRPCAEVDGIARRHVEDIDRRIARLVSLRRELQHSLDACGRGRVSDCRVIEALGDPALIAG